MLRAKFAQVSTRSGSAFSHRIIFLGPFWSFLDQHVFHLARFFWIQSQTVIYGSRGGPFWGSLLGTLWDHFGDHFWIEVTRTTAHPDAPQRREWNKIDLENEPEVIIKVSSRWVLKCSKIMSFDGYHSLLDSKISCHFSTAWTVYGIRFHMWPQPNRKLI